MVKRQGQKKRGIPKYTRKKIILLGVEGDNKTERHYFNHISTISIACRRSTLFVLQKVMKLTQ